MAEAVLLDAGPLGMLAHPRPSSQILDWLERRTEAGDKVFIAEIADYEVRRELLRAKRIKGIRRLDRLRYSLGFVAITSGAMLLAAEYWAVARQQGVPTAPDLALDADMILAAQSAELAQAGDAVTVATDNVKHLNRFVVARSWKETGW